MTDQIFCKNVTQLFHILSAALVPEGYKIVACGERWKLEGPGLVPLSMTCYISESHKSHIYIRTDINDRLIMVMKFVVDDDCIYLFDPERMPNAKEQNDHFYVAYLRGKFERLAPK